MGAGAERRLGHSADRLHARGRVLASDPFWHPAEWYESPTLCVNAGWQASAGRDAYPAVSRQAAVRKSLMLGHVVLLLSSRLLNVRARKGLWGPGSCALKCSKGYKR